MSYSVEDQQQSRPKALRSMSMEMEEVTEEETDEIFDVAVFAVVASSRNASSNSESTSYPPSFQDSLRTFLDGSEFMINFDDALDANVATVNAEEDQRTKDAVQRGARMARRCICTAVGSYQPFDAADPSTWEENKQKEFTRKQSKSSKRIKAPIRNNTDERLQQEEDNRPSSHTRRSTSPMVSSYVMEQQNVTDLTHQEQEAPVKEEKRKDRRNRHRLSSAMVSPHLLGQQEKVDNRDPEQEDKMMSNFLSVLQDINDRKYSQKTERERCIRPASIPEDFVLVLQEINERQQDQRTAKMRSDVEPSRPNLEEFVLVLQEINGRKKNQKTERKRHSARASESTRKEEDTLMGNFLLVLQDINDGKNNKKTQKKKPRRPRHRSLSPVDSCESDMDLSAKFQRTAEEKRIERKKKRRSQDGSLSPKAKSHHPPLRTTATADEEDRYHDETRKTTGNKDPSSRRRRRHRATAPTVSTFVLEKQENEDRQREQARQVKEMDGSCRSLDIEPTVSSAASTVFKITGDERHGRLMQ